MRPSRNCGGECGREFNQKRHGRRAPIPSARGVPVGNADGVEAAVEQLLGLLEEGAGED